MIGICVAVDICTETVDVFSEPVDDSTETVDVSTETVDVVCGTATKYTFHIVSCGCSYECDAGTVWLDYLTGGVNTTSNEATHIALCFTTGPQLLSVGR